MENKKNDKQKESKQAEKSPTEKTKTNKYTPEEKKFADGEGTKLDKAIDGDIINPVTRGD